MRVAPCGRHEGGFASERRGGYAEGQTRGEWPMQTLHCRGLGRGPDSAGRSGAMRTITLGLHAAISLLMAPPAGGFLLGILNAGDPDPNPIGRFVHACMMTVATPLHAGFPPNSAAGAGHSFNAWPHILAAFVLCFGGLRLRSRWSADSNRSEEIAKTRL